ncbi:MFS transporter [Thalassotalea euphylliae]|uniref:MFS transporter n=1 Tax=Thalassotalea euphylliae TaxID=1655234 RepID=UPI003645C6AA
MLKLGLILLTVISVVADTMLLPFYPQFFEQEFGITSSQHVGLYIAATCLTVMLAFPVWARVARRVEELHLWVVTQIIAGCLGIACFYAADVISFWVASQLMLVFKASYLLIYPFVLRLEDKNKHLGIVGLFSVLMHFGGIGGALLGGAIIENFSARDVFLVMAASDAIQVIFCLALNHKLNLKWQLKMPTHDAAKRKRVPAFVWQIGGLSLLLYFSAFLARPYLAQYWQQVSGIGSELIAGLVYAIPAWIALACLWYQSKAKPNNQHFKIMAQALSVGALGLMLQATSEPSIVVLGRCLLGVTLFITTVRLEVMLFEQSEPQFYGEDFSLVHIFQNIGVILASLCVGQVVAEYTLATPFYIAAVGFIVTLFALLYLKNYRAKYAALVPSES